MGNIINLPTAQTWLEKAAAEAEEKVEAFRQADLLGPAGQALETTRHLRLV